MKMERICIICGSPAFVSNYCEKCYLKGQILFQVPEKIQVKLCTNCGSYYDRGWKREDLEGILLGKLETKNHVARKEVKVMQGHAVFSGSGRIKPSRRIVEETKKVPLLIERRKCEDCIKLLSGYYQAIFQIRGSMSEEIFGKVASAVGDGEIMPAKAKNGYDVKFIDKKRASSVAGLLKGFAIRKTYKLITEKKGKKLYRDYYSIR
ncbi:MAG: hypothetical protein HY368_01435 [Candidatus Aenigmarchaeota archaeon]|nr:hypothetical protein [Candidatus Aenigmarchaeota archaeon]